MSPTVCGWPARYGRTSGLQWAPSRPVEGSPTCGHKLLLWRQASPNLPCRGSSRRRTAASLTHPGRTAHLQLLLERQLGTLELQQRLLHS